MDTNIYAREYAIRPIEEISFDVILDYIHKMSAFAYTDNFDVPDLYDINEPKRGHLIDYCVNDQKKYVRMIKK